MDPLHRSEMRGLLGRPRRAAVGNGPVPRASGPEIARFVITYVLRGREDGWKIIVAAAGRANAA